MVVVAQLVRALDCGSRGRRFEPGLPPQGMFKVLQSAAELFYFTARLRNHPPTLAADRPLYCYLYAVEGFNYNRGGDR